MRTVVLLLTITLIGLLPGTGKPVEFQKGDRILLYGNAFVERMQERGRFEAAIHLAFPGKNLQFRSLAWTGDEVGYRLRPERYTDHLKKLLDVWPADLVILGGFGWFEAFENAQPDPNGRRTVERFATDLQNYLREIRRRHPAARLVLLLPSNLPKEVAGEKLAEEPLSFDRYSKAMAEVAGEMNVDTVRLQEFVTRHHRGENEGTRREMDVWLAMKLTALEEPPDPRRLEEVAKAVSQKASLVSTVVRPVNAVIYFGVRGRPEEYEREMPRYHQLVTQADQVIHALAIDPEKMFEDCPKPSLPPMPAATKRGGAKEGSILSPAGQQQTIEVADGYELNLFASEEQFPDLKNPVQIAFGPRGRLWVVTMASFPHTVPGEQPNDKILVLEDTDRDGTADKQTVFADGLNVPDGLVFYKDGIIVSAQPRLLYIWDSDGDGRADQQKELLRGIDVTDAHHGGMIAMDPLGHVIFSDGVFHRSQFETPFGVVRGVDATTYRFDPTSGRVETEYQTLTPNPWKVTFDRWGNLFHMFGDGFVQDSQLLPWTPLGIYHPFKRAVSVAYGKGSGAEVISSPNFPDEYQQGMASATLLGRSFVALSRLDASTGFHQASDRLDVLSSDNVAFRPVDLAFGFDGALYVSDFCSAIIGHAQHPMRDPRWDHDHGRIWRVVHSAKPLVRKWPDVAGAGRPELLKLLAYPQNNIRALARHRLRNTHALKELLDAHLELNPKLPQDQVLQHLWLLASRDKIYPRVWKQLLDSDDFRIRAAATRLIRFQAGVLNRSQSFHPGDATLEMMATDPHPRVRIEFIKAISHLQQRIPSMREWLAKVDPGGNEVVATMLRDARHGTTAAKGPEVPVLEVPQETLIQNWLKGNNLLVVDRHGNRELKEAALHTYLTSEQAQSAVLSLRHQHARVSVNGTQLLDAHTWWSSDWNLQVLLREGLNKIEVEFTGGKRAQGIAPVYLFDPLGKPLPGTEYPATEDALRDAANEYLRSHGAGENTLMLSAVSNRLSFSPKTLRVAAGRKMTFLFVNPDQQIHNVVIAKPGTREQVGYLADQLVLDPRALKRQYVPKSNDIVWSTPLVNGLDRLELEFTAPSTPGRYPILCTFPGHWRVMQATLIVE